ncbi:hypothetical protein [Streptomyces sp. NRRL F-2580]|uniref:hypothetical protein n=1 Tax=Streptomyces sp. NRRL F-2580 TaxID=1463841 RepID=UPI0004CBDF78|nr:hypothetical protein [Streptomyces sp. NRRL F-2580]
MVALAPDGAAESVLFTVDPADGDGTPPASPAPVRAALAARRSRQHDPHRHAAGQILRLLATRVESRTAAP